MSIFDLRKAPSLFTICQKNNCYRSTTLLFGLGRTISQFDNKKPGELESEFDHFDADNLYPTSLFKSHNIVDLDFVYKQLLDGFKACKTTLSLKEKD